MTCPYLEYRRGDEDRTFEVDRAYCTAAGEFVQPMRADICNDRYDLLHERDCEIYREHAPDDPDVDESGSASADDASGDPEANR